MSLINLILIALVAAQPQGSGAVGNAVANTGAISGATDGTNTGSNARAIVDTNANANVGAGAKPESNANAGAGTTSENSDASSKEPEVVPEVAVGPLEIGKSKGKGTVGQLEKSSDTCDFFHHGYHHTVEVNKNLYFAGKSCGVCVKLTNPQNNQTIQARINSVCNDCTQDFMLPESIYPDLHFKPLEGAKKTELDWEVVQCVGSPNGGYFVDRRNPELIRLSIAHLIKPIKQVLYYSNSTNTWKTAKHDESGYYLFDPNSFGVEHKTQLKIQAADGDEINFPLADNKDNYFNPHFQFKKGGPIPLQHKEVVKPNSKDEDTPTATSSTSTSDAKKASCMLALAVIPALFLLA